jgi:phage terminase small subunit
MRAEVADIVGITPAMMAAELKRLALSDMGDFVTWDGGGVTLRRSSEVETRCVVEVSETTSPTGGTVKFKLHDKRAAIADLNKMMGWNAPDKTEVTGKDGGPIEVSDAKSALAARLARLNRKSDPPSP